MTSAQLRAITKAASFIRFTANNWEWLEPAARAEALAIVAVLSEIESAELDCGDPNCVDALPDLPV